MLTTQIVSSGIPVESDRTMIERDLIKSGNRDVTGADFNWILTDYVSFKEYPKNMVTLERKEWGNLYGYLSAIKENDAEEVFNKIIEGEITSTSDVRLIRDGTIVYTGKVGSLFREKNQVKQVSNGQECGITIKDYIDIQKGDTLEAFNVTSKERTI